ncbi:hypothetical protein AB5I41_04585 [Sphingomonas sp. MMS24-JH45]
MFELVVAGRKIDGRTTEAKRFRAIGTDLPSSSAHPRAHRSASLLMNAATIAMLCEQATADLLEGKVVDHENHRRNVAMLGQLLIKLGLAMKSRDVTKRDSARTDDFGAALIEASRQPS